MLPVGSAITYKCLDVIMLDQIIQCHTSATTDNYWKCTLISRYGGSHTHIHLMLQYTPSCVQVISAIYSHTVIVICSLLHSC